MYPKNQNLQNYNNKRCRMCGEGRWIQVSDHKVMEVERCEMGLSGGGGSVLC